MIPVLKPGDIGFMMTHNNVISKIFRWAMGSKWSHSFLVHEVTPRHVYTSETSDFEVQIHLLEVYLNNPHVSLEVWRKEELSEGERRRIAEQAVKKNLGDTYGYLQLVSFGLRILLRKVGLKIKNFIKQGTVCCGHVASGYHLAKIPGWEFDPEGIDTEEMYQIIQGMGFKRIAYKPKGQII
jgi:hypothetical protein